VSKGDPIAYIYQPELDIQQNTLKHHLNDYLQAHERMTELEKKNLNETLSSYQSQQEQLNNSIRLAKEQIELYLTQEESYRSLYEKGIASQQDYDKAQVTRMNAQVSLQNQQSQLDSIHKAVNDAQTQYELTIKQRELNISQQERQIAEQDDRRVQEGKVYSPSNGIVCEVSVSEGQNISVNSLIVLIDENEPDTPDGDTINLEAVVFVNSVSAKKVQNGQQSLISPTIVRPSQYGSITGSVTSVSNFPLTQARLATVLPDGVLDQQLLSQGSVFEVRLKLDKHPSSPSGYRWTSGEGPEIQIYSGTLTNAMICVEQRRPITYLVPFLKKHLLGDDSYGVYH
jgi:HlyD family secretion protein